MHTLHAEVAPIMADVATRIILPRYQKLTQNEISEKEPGELVTIADQESEAALSEALLPLIPGARIIGEESCAAHPALLDTLGEGTVWLIDPIDGTANFVSGQPPFGIMLALLHDGVAQAGWLYDPLTQRLCHGVKGGGAFINGTRITAHECVAPKPIAAMSTHFMTPAQIAERAAQLDPLFTRVPIPRCAAEQYPRLATGVNDISLFVRTHAWDHVPGALILEEAGGKVARLDGSPYVPTERREGMIAASSPRLWDLAARVLID